MTPREWVLADLDKRIALAKAATPGPWAANANGVHRPDGTCVATTHQETAESRRRDARHIASHDPSRMVAVWEWLREQVRMHRPTERVHPNPGGPAWTEQVCAACGDWWNCRFVASLAASLGYETGGGERPIRDLIEASSLGEPDAVAARASVSDEQVARVMDRVRELDADPPSAEAATPHAEGEPETHHRLVVYVDRDTVCKRIECRDPASCPDTKPEYREQHGCAVTEWFDADGDILDFPRGEFVAIGSLPVAARWDGDDEEAELWIVPPAPAPAQGVGE